MEALTICPWCLSTPPRHDRCEQLVYVPRKKTGEALDSVGATVPTYDQPCWVACSCPCHMQEYLW